MANPFNINPNNIDISKLERVFRKTVFDQLLLQYKERPCITDDIEQKLKNVNSLAELNSFIGSLDLHLLLNLAISKISSFSPANFNDFIQYVDESTLLLSCLTKKAAETLKNASTPAKKFNLVDGSIELAFDFFKFFRDELEKVLRGIILELLRNVFLEVLSFIDCDKVHKCIVPCDPDSNPYKNLFTKVKIKEGTQAKTFVMNKVKDLKLDITHEELQTFYQKAVDSLLPEEINCLLKGFLSTNIIKFLKDLFNSLFNTTTSSESQIVDIFQGVVGIVDIIPGNISTIPTNPCGNISLETIAIIKLIQEGKTEQQAQDIVNQIIQDSGTKLSNISTFLKDIPYETNIDSVSNSDIVKTIVNKSIDTIFDSIDNTRLTSIYAMNNILLKPIGEVCCAVYWQEDALRDSFAIPQAIKDYIDAQVKDPFIVDNNFYNNPINLLINTDNLYQKYDLENRQNKKQIYTLQYMTDNIINVYDDHNIVFKITNEYIIDINNNVRIPITSTTDLGLYEYSILRNNISNLLFGQNNNLLSNYFILPVENILSNIYTNINNFLELNIGKTFYFQEFNTDNHISNNKKKFINLDYFNINEVKNRVKVALNV